MIRTFVILTILLVQATLFTCKAQAQQEALPDFRGIFDVWQKNRAIYNQYNDSAFLFQNYKDWTAFFNRRSVKVHQIYEEDRAIMQDYASYFRNRNHAVSTEAYVALRDELYHDMTTGKMGDPFILMATCDVLEKAGAQVPDSLKSTNLINSIRLFGYMQMWNLGGDMEYMKKAYQCGKFLLSDEAKKFPFYDYSISAAMRYMPRTWWLVYKLQTIPEYREYCRRLKEYLARPDIDKLINHYLKDNLQHILDTADESLVRNTYLVDATTMDKQEADSIMRAVVKRNLANEKLSDLSYIRTLYMQVSLGEITAKQALDKSLELYGKTWGKVNNWHMDVFQLDAYLQPFYTFFYLNYKAGISTDQKRANVLRMTRDIETAFINRKDQRRNTDYVRDLLRLSTYDKVTMYLTPEEVERFLSDLNVATQPASYVHSLNTAKISDVILEGVVKYKPELLVGVLGNQTVQDVKKNKKKIVSFVHQAALYHDIGKISIATLMNKGHRPLLREENQLMRKHPEFGVKYLEQTPSLAQYKDIALGHHKWYNGKGGYPENFDNTQSPIRILIDVVTLAGSMQEAAERCVRTEGYVNPLTAKMEALRQGAGIQYNPDLVALLNQHNDIKDKIAYLVDEGWVKTSYEIAKTYFEKLKK